MRNHVLNPFFLLLVIAICFSFRPQNQLIETINNRKNQTHPNELIVAFENLSDKQLVDLDEAIAQIPGVKNFGYCQRKRLYFFTYDEQIYKTEEQVMDAISIHTKKYQPLLKIGTSVDQITKQCNN
jgi:hypothetical protein